MMERSLLTSDGRLLGGILLAFAVIAAAAGVDILLDLRSGTTVAHVLVEGGLLAVGLAGSILIARMLLRTRREARELAVRLRATEADAARWRAEASDLLRGLGAALDRQFERWRLTAAEKEVALLLLKGLSHKEVAQVRSITEATARQQARGVYRKAGLTGRHDLAAFFLEDLLLPATGKSEPPALE
jgi:DNA-binding CsgD family transcriptional regulator